jgi:DNA polymerase-3 subunit gamma/tau
MEYDIANTRGIDTTREIAANAQFSPMTGKVKVYILDEVHSMTKDGQNALLKILEDTPKHVYFFLCTTDPDKLLKTIVTRCMRFEVKTLPGPVMSKLLKDTVLSEGITDFHDSVIQAIVKAADGCPRQAMILLDSVIDIIDETPALLAVAEAMATVTASIDICRLLLETTKYDKWEKMVVMLRGLQDDNAEKMRYAILRFMSGAMLKDWSDRATVQQASSVIDQFTESFMYTGKAGLVNACYNACLI